MSKETPTVNAEIRDHKGSKYAQRLRKLGRLPIVIYGHKLDPVHISVDAEEFDHYLHQGSHLVSVEIGSGASEICLLKDVQYDYLGTTIIHADMARVNLDEDIEVSVALVTKGLLDSPGLKEVGAYVDTIMTDVPVRCRADMIPGEIPVDLSESDAGTTIYVDGLVLPDGVKTDVNDDSPV